MEFKCSRVAHQKKNFLNSGFKILYFIVMNCNSSVVALLDVFHPGEYVYLKDKRSKTWVSGWGPDSSCQERHKDLLLCSHLWEKNKPLSVSFWQSRQLFTESIRVKTVTEAWMDDRGAWESPKRTVKRPIYTFFTHDIHTHKHQMFGCCHV